MFVFPSLYEGFGLPVIEALACGTVAIVSRGSSVPEVAGDGAEYFDPRSAESLVQSFRALLHNPQRQEELRVKGLARARRFTWDQTARRVLALYDTLFDTARTRNR